MPRLKKESEAELKARARKILAGLYRAYPDSRCALNFRTPLDLYVATVLSAQCTDERVNQVTPELFRRCRAPQDYLALGQDGLENAIRSTGFFRSKAKSILGGCRVLVEEFGGTMPRTMEQMRRLPGVGRKTANVVLGVAFGVPGIPVDTHVGRVTRRLELTRQTDPVKVEFDLQPLFPKKDWTQLSLMLIRHGRECCKARRPECERCPLATHCPYPRRMGLPVAGATGKGKAGAVRPRTASGRTREAARPAGKSAALGTARRKIKGS